MKTNDLVLVETPTGNFYGKYLESVDFHRMCYVEIIKIKKGSKWTSPEQSGIRYLIEQKYVAVILTEEELQCL